MDIGYYLKDYAPDFGKLKEYGFEEREGVWIYEQAIEGSLKLVLTLSKDAFTAKVWDEDFGDEYLPFNVEDNRNSVRAKAEERVSDVVKNCFVNLNVRVSAVEAMEKRYGTVHEAPWEEDPDSITFKTKISRKWYAIMMRIPADRLGLQGKNLIDVVNIKLPPEKIDSLIDGKHYFRAYHMNKVHWISIKLDKDLDKGEFLSLVDVSYALAEKKSRDRTK